MCPLGSSLMLMFLSKIYLRRASLGLTLTRCMSPSHGCLFIICNIFVLQYNSCTRSSLLRLTLTRCMSPSHGCLFIICNIFVLKYNSCTRSSLLCLTLAQDISVLALGHTVVSLSICNTFELKYYLCIWSSIMLNTDPGYSLCHTIVINFSHVTSPVI